MAYIAYSMVMLRSAKIGTVAGQPQALAPLAAELLAARAFIKYLMLWGSQERTAAFAEIAPRMTGGEFVTAARDVWEAEDQPSVNIGFWRRTLSDCAKCPELFMNSKERKRLASLPHPVTIYRGADSTESVPTGLAWTTSLRQAWFFAFSYNRGNRSGNGHVFETAIDPRHIFAFLLERQENEILVFPEKIDGWQRIRQAAVEKTLRQNPMNAMEALEAARAAIPARDTEFKACKAPPTQGSGDQNDLADCFWFLGGSPKLKRTWYVAVNRVYGTTQIC